MSVRGSLVTSFARAIDRGSRVAERSSRDRHNLDVVLQWALQRIGSRTVLFPGAYIELLRSCLEQTRLTITDVKVDPRAPSDLSGRRFSSLVEALRQLPPVEFSTAAEIALVADSYRGNLTPIEVHEWTGDVGSLFEISSCKGKKGRILTTIVRFTRSSQCLELGTAYGMSALFVLEALKAGDAAARLTTLEGWDLLFSLSSPMLTARHGNRVSCRLGSTQDALPGLVKSLGPLDFVFHDAGHSRDDYVRDFLAILPGVRPGAVVLIDDIRWEDPRFFQGTPRCYEGWLELVNHPRVQRAVEIDGAMGLLLVGG